MHEWLKTRYQALYTGGGGFSPKNDQKTKIISHAIWLHTCFGSRICTKLLNGSTFSYHQSYISVWGYMYHAKSRQACPREAFDPKKSHSCTKIFFATSRNVKISFLCSKRNQLFSLTHFSSGGHCQFMDPNISLYTSCMGMKSNQITFICKLNVIWGVFHTF